MSASGTLGQRQDPISAFRFHLEVDGILLGGFSEVSGVELEVELEPYEEGGVNHFIHQLPKATRHSNLVLTRGVLLDRTVFWDWFRLVQHGSIERRNGRIVLIDGQGVESGYFRFVEAYPVRLRMSELNAASDGVLTETLELAHNGLDRGIT